MTRQTGSQKLWEVFLMKKSFNDSLILSWSFYEDGIGTLLIGDKDPLGIEQRIRVIDAKFDEEGLELLKALGVELE